MKTKLASIAIIAAFIASCTNPKTLSSVKTGMTRDQVLLSAGEPAKKNDIEVAELWVYPDANRTIVFRKDTVYSIITSGEARVDSIKMSMDNLKNDVDRGLEKLGTGLEKTSDQFDSIAHRVKKGIDTLRNKKN